ncbi:MAG: S8 family serine peptidase, partial [Clostridia bacterium]|nr:S8 family serine peptidase [Clostridia bacterium]
MAKRALAAGIALVLIFTAFAALLLAGGFVFAPDFKVIESNQASSLSNEQRYIVKFRADASVAKIADLLKETDYCIIGNSQEKLFAVSNVNADFFNAQGDIIEYYEADTQRNVLATVNDTEPTPYYEAMGVNTAWDKTTGSKDVVVAILDTGINRTHQDLLNANILDGYDAVTRTVGVFADEVGHGTAVAGIIAAEANNNFGIAGVAYGVTIMPVKVSYSGTAIYSSDLVRGIRYAADNGAKIINMSLGGYSASIAEQEAVNYAISKGCILISAAGNGGNGEHADAKSYPASYEGVVSVASCDGFGERSLFSQYNNKVDIAAIGENIVIPAVDENGISVYRTDSGTSYACAIVSGIAALAVSVAGDVRFNGAEFDALIAELGNYTRDDNLGYGIIYAHRAVELAETPIITGVENGKKYSQSVKIGFNRGTATLNGEAVSDGEALVADGVHTLAV